MEIQIISDLHLESPKAYDVFDITPNAPVLALLGDIGNVAQHKADLLDFLTRQLGQFTAVLFVPGNHEAYRSNWKETLDILRAFERDVRDRASLGEFILLDRAVYRLPDTNTVILGCSLFSSVSSENSMAISVGLNDFFDIADWDTDSHNEAHKRDVSWLNAQVAELEQSDVQIMIFTHWSPSQDARSVDPKHASSPISSAFSTDLFGEKCFQSTKVRVWAFGHTHYNCDFTVERKADASPLRLLANQRGYYFAQAEGYDGGKTVGI